MSMKNSNDTIGNRTRDLPACPEVVCGAILFLFCLATNCYEAKQKFCKNLRLVKNILVFLSLMSGSLCPRTEGRVTYFLLLLLLWRNSTTWA
jgi:hypothetical protein